MRKRAPVWYTIQAIIGTLLEEAVVVAIVLYWLPQLNVHIPLWGLIILVAVVAIISYVTYRIGRPTFFLRPRVALENIIGSEGKVVKLLAPEGYVKVQGVLWKARCTESQVEEGDEVMVVGTYGLKLVVVRKGNLDTASRKLPIN